MVFLLLVTVVLCDLCGVPNLVLFWKILARPSLWNIFNISLAIQFLLTGLLGPFIVSYGSKLIFSDDTIHHHCDVFLSLHGLTYFLLGLFYFWTKRKHPRKSRKPRKKLKKLGQLRRLGGPGKLAGQDG